MNQLLKELKEFLVKSELMEGTVIFYNEKRHYYYNNEWMQSYGVITDYCTYSNNDNLTIINEGKLSDLLVYGYAGDSTLNNLMTIINKHGYDIEPLSSWCFQLIEL